MGAVSNICIRSERQGRLRLGSDLRSRCDTNHKCSRREPQREPWRSSHPFLSAGGGAAGPAQPCPLAFSSLSILPWHQPPLSPVPSTLADTELPPIRVPGHTQLPRPHPCRTALRPHLHKSEPEAFVSAPSHPLLAFPVLVNSTMTHRCSRQKPLSPSSLTRTSNHQQVLFILPPKHMSSPPTLSSSCHTLPGRRQRLPDQFSKQPGLQSHKGGRFLPSNLGGCSVPFLAPAWLSPPWLQQLALPPSRPSRRPSRRRPPAPQVSCHRLYSADSGVVHITTVLCSRPHRGRVVISGETESFTQVLLEFFKPLLCTVPVDAPLSRGSKSQTGNESHGPFQPSRAHPRSHCQRMRWGPHVELLSVDTKAWREANSPPEGHRWTQRDRGQSRAKGCSRNEKNPV